MLILYRLSAPAVELAEVTLLSPVEAATRLVATGYVVSRHSSTIAPVRSGRLSAIYADEGDRLAAGELAAELESSAEAAALKQARAEATAQAAQLERRRTEAAQAATDLARQRRLLAGGAGTQALVDSARAALRTAQAQLAAATAELQAALARVHSAEVAYDQTQLRAPFDATVTRKLAEVGDIVTPGLQGGTGPSGVLVVADLGALEVEVDISESQLAQVAERLPAAVVLDAEPGRSWPAELSTLRPASDRSRAAITAKVRFTGGVPPLAAPDMGARVSVLTKPLGPQELARPPSPSVPASAVVVRHGRPVVLVVEDGRVREVAVQPGERARERIALGQGPPARTRVVAAPGPRLKSGSRIRERRARP